MRGRVSMLMVICKPIMVGGKMPIFRFHTRTHSSLCPPSRRIGQIAGEVCGLRQTFSNYVATSSALSEARDVLGDDVTVSTPRSALR